MQPSIPASGAAAQSHNYQEPQCARIDASGMAKPSAQLNGFLASGMKWSNRLATDMMSSGRRDAYSAARAEALENILSFYPMRMDPKPNADYLNQGQFGTTSARDQTALRRQNSFLSVARQLDDVQELAFTPAGEPRPYLDPDSSEVLEESLRTIQVLPAAMHEVAIARARAGERALPLTLDTARMRAFLADNEAALSQVVQACAGGTGNAQRLSAPLQTLATEYLRRNGQLPSGLTPSMPADYRGAPMSNDPVSVFVGSFPNTDMRVMMEGNGSRDKCVVSLGRDVVSEPLKNNDPLIQGFESKTPAEKRAAAILQSFFKLLTFAEESIQASGLHARTDAERRKGAGTKTEFGYLGSPRIGDAIDPQDGEMSQRMRAVMPLAELADHDASRQASGSARLVSDQALADWMDSPKFNKDMNDIVSTKLRLSNAQVPYTAAALLGSRAFGGSGLR
jgi:hypothetical protein